MSNSKVSKFVKILLRLLLVLALIGLVWFLLATANRRLQATLDPIQQTNNALSTQVSSLLHPTPTVIPDPVTIIDKVRAVARLETIHYTIEKVVTAEVNQGAFGWLVGERILFVAHGYVIAGIDMGKITTDFVMEEDQPRVVEFLR